MVISLDARGFQIRGLISKMETWGVEAGRSAKSSKTCQAKIQIASATAQQPENINAGRECSGL